MNPKRSILLVIALTCALIVLTACTSSISEIKNDEHIGKQVSVKGEISNTLKIGDLSGYTLTDKEGDSISISSNELPKEGSSKTVSGIVRKSLLLGYYIETN